MRIVKRHSGFTLVELLVVVAIIVIITGVAVPILARGGLFSGNKTNAAAAVWFAQLRAAHLHATTNNVDTALAYGVIAPYDSLFSGTVGVNVQIDTDIVPAQYIANYDSVPTSFIANNFIDDALYDPQNAVLDSTLLVRRVTVEDLKEEDSVGTTLAEAFVVEGTFLTYNAMLNADIFMPAVSASAVFEPLPNDACVLTNHPTTDDTPTSFQEKTGLTGIYIFRVQLVDDEWLVESIAPRVVRNFPIAGIDNLNTTWDLQFPAHIFNKKGGMEVDSTLQRFTLSVGQRPDAEYLERFLVDENSGLIVLDANDELISIDTDVELYKTTGRIKVSDDTQ